MKFGLFTSALVPPRAASSARGSPLHGDTPKKDTALSADPNRNLLISILCIIKIPHLLRVLKRPRAWLRRKPRSHFFLLLLLLLLLCLLCQVRHHRLRNFNE